jgi:hypothetical protein
MLWEPLGRITRFAKRKYTITDKARQEQQKSVILLHRTSYFLHRFNVPDESRLGQIGMHILVG